MNPEIKAKWIEDLRSGEYTQGRGSLHTFDGAFHNFCCLGVLCDIAEKAGVVSSEIAGGAIWGRFGYGRSFALGMLPDEVVAWAGLDNANPQIDAESDFGKCLTTINDCDRQPFSAIADLIEAQL